MQAKNEPADAATPAAGLDAEAEARAGKLKKMHACWLAARADLAAKEKVQKDKITKATLDLAEARKWMTEKHPDIIRLRDCLAQVKSNADPDIKRLTKQCADLCTKLTSTINTEIKRLEIEDRKLAELYTASFPKRQKIASKIRDLRSLMPSS